MSATLRIRNWKEFQHYKHRNPPWIKLHRKLLDNREYQSLSDGAARLLVDLWLIASESDDGSLEFDSAALAWRLRRSVYDIREHIQALIRSGFLIANGHDASSTLALGLQDAAPEVETERELERENCTVDAAKNAAPPAQDDRTELWTAIRTHLYVPDGTPPSDWDESRDGSILKALRARYSTQDLAAAIEGVAVIRDFPGKYSDAVDWLKPGTKATLRVLYNTRSGVQPLFAIATQAYWKRANARPKDRRQPEQLGSVLRAVAGGAG